MARLANGEVVLLIVNYYNWLLQTERFSYFLMSSPAIFAKMLKVIFVKCEIVKVINLICRLHANGLNDVQYIASLRKISFFNPIFSRILQSISPVGMETSESSWHRRRPTWTTARGRTRRSTSSGSTVRSLEQPVQGSGSHTGSSVSTLQKHRDQCCGSKFFYPH